MNKWLSLLTNIHIHPLLWFVAFIAVITANFKSLFIVFLIVLFHELGHAFAAHFFSWRIKKILLLPFGGVAEMDEHGNRPLKEELIVTLAGPVQHLFIFLLAYLGKESGWLSIELFSEITAYNLSILCINLLPIWPLDGGKLLFLVWTYFTSFRRAHEWTIYCSAGLLMVFFMLLIAFTPTQLSLWMIGLFLAYSLRQEWRHRQYVWMRFLLERYYGKKVEYRSLKRLVVAPTDPLFRVLLMFQRGKKHAVVVEKGREEFELDENELLHAYFREKRTNDVIANLLYPY
ncbi:stage IV sporulation protein FB [Thermolongibacillus altinsuensis]|uniref:Stage IV sporulation protein FB n=1 Tax=Thermolongibacillus altinsuensis TaxID=575256 RepID=A0A4R1QIQ9_9BACL|nr:M50 family metallopeptidase [Thermolongibacillus altinsuensis]TCL51944.1 stage IV sporulation protein FB [Thermolongibacillus altinsuensis]